jgi:hypothetical protein
MQAFRLLCGKSFQSCSLINFQLLRRTKNGMRMNKSGDFNISNVVQLVYFFFINKNHLKWVAVLQ